VNFTEADLTALRQLGCDLVMTPLEEGVCQTFQGMEALLG
jgi:hypothetical protein